MSEQKFTPAPWSQAHRICDEEGNYSTQVFSTETGETIATLAWAKMPPKKVVIDGKQKIQTGTYREGNAKLIATAPELLDIALRLKKSLDDNRSKNYMIELLAREFVDLDETIKKALS